MYTQCPDCKTAFRVTADVLKQAAGKVRCGGCSNAFNALEYLSEKAPQQPATDNETPEPELTAEPRLNDDGSPMSISAEHSAALMKTLEELEGSDIRIEDTGVEWRVLDDVDDSDSIGDVDSMESPAPDEELRFDDNTPLPEDFEAGDDTGHEHEHSESGKNESAEKLDSSNDPEQPDVSLGEPGEWADILDEVEQPLVPAELPLEAELIALEKAEAGGPPDVDTQFAMQAAEMGIDVSGAHQVIAEVDEEATRQHHFDEEEEQVDEPEVEVVDEAPLEFGSVDTAIRELEAQSDVFDADFFGAAVVTGSDIDENDNGEEPDLDLPPPSEEEQSLNLMIDQELLDVAVADDDGFASTIVIPNEGAEDKALAEQKVELVQEERTAGFESIVMEGESVRTTLDKEKHEADVAAAAMLGGQARDEKDDSYVPYSGDRQRAVVVAVIALVMLLLLQVVHQSREELATLPTFNGILSPLYRTIGMPLSPAWEVSGWRFEASPDELVGNADTGEEQLNIYPRVGNNSDKALPYPLISVSLTDRFEATVGGRVLEPAEYLFAEADPRELVPPGETFDAVISIRSPAREVTGYKLKVCYRLSDGQLRCNVPVFK